ncbi:M23 family metallopeptidase [Patescibacteria group bacterium]|nr:M23 family metallopeptidase [Patescibacteria group bacterium]
MLVASAALFTFPLGAQAFSFMAPFRSAPVAEAEERMSRIHLSSTPALTAAVHTDPNPVKGGGDITVVDDVALLAEDGPQGTLADIDGTPASTRISLYVVRRGDTLSGIARMFGVTTNTVLWANDLKSARDIRPGDQLVILPISGIRHTVEKGETLQGIVKKYKGDIAEVLAYNGWESGATVSVGDEIIIPNGVENRPQVTSPVRGGGGPELAGYFMRPIVGGRRTQGIHGYNAVDIAIPVGTPVVASAPGTVTVARSSGWNGGYGSYIVISHPNGTQTVYGHLSSVSIGQGQQVSQGQLIGYSGNTGRSTGAHLHFEVRGARNPF